MTHYHHRSNFVSILSTLYTTVDTLFLVLPKNKKILVEGLQCFLNNLYNSSISCISSKLIRFVISVTFLLYIKQALSNFHFFLWILVYERKIMKLSKKKYKCWNIYNDYIQVLIVYDTEISEERLTQRGPAGYFHTKLFCMCPTLFTAHLGRLNFFIYLAV